MFVSFIGRVDQIFDCFYKLQGGVQPTLSLPRTSRLWHQLHVPSQVLGDKTLGGEIMGVDEITEQLESVFLIDTF